MELLVLAVMTFSLAFGFISTCVLRVLSQLSALLEGFFFFSQLVLGKGAFSWLWHCFPPDNASLFGLNCADWIGYQATDVCGDGDPEDQVWTRPGMIVQNVSLPQCSVIYAWHVPLFLCS